MDKDTERMMDTIMFLASLSMSAVRFARGENPFDFESLSVAEFISAKAFPFIEDENVDYRKAHTEFIQMMVENGWSCGPEDFSARKHPDLVSWDSLGKSSKEMYGYIAGIVCSARGFYSSLRADLENEFMSSIGVILNRKAFTALRGNTSTH